jgi:hypothetical protein
MSGRADGGASGGGVTPPPVDEVRITDHPIATPYQREENPSNPGGALWIRKWKLSLGPKSSIPADGKADVNAPLTAVDLSDLDFIFNVQSSTQPHPPSTAYIRIYNLTPKVLVQLKELVSVWLEAGYREPATQYGRIFSGQIVYYRYGQDTNAVDTFVDIHAFQDELPTDWAIINTVLPAGHTKRDVLQAVADAMGVKLGQVADLGDEQSPRARTLYGMARDVLRDIKETAGAQTFLGKDGKLNVLGKGEPLTMQNVIVPVLNSKTGLVGMPSVTIGKGVDIKSLLNPAIIPGGQVRINQADVAQIVPVDTSRFQKLGFDVETHKLNIQADGYYRVVTVNHSGESRGNNWFTNAITESFDPMEQPPSLRTSV